MTRQLVSSRHSHGLYLVLYLTPRFLLPHNPLAFLPEGDLHKFIRHNPPPESFRCVPHSPPAENSVNISLPYRRYCDLSAPQDPLLAAGALQSRHVRGVWQNTAEFHGEPSHFSSPRAALRSPRSPPKSIYSLSPSLFPCSRAP